MIRWLLLLLLSAPAWGQDWTIRYREGRWKVHGWVENGRVHVSCRPIQPGPQPRSVSVNVFPPAYTTSTGYLALALQGNGREAVSDVIPFQRGTSKLEVTIFFDDPRPVRATSEQTSFLLKGWQYRHR